MRPARELALPPVLEGRYQGTSPGGKAGPGLPSRGRALGKMQGQSERCGWCGKEPEGGWASVGPLGKSRDKLCRSGIKPGPGVGREPHWREWIPEVSTAQ